jgi:hypothetical protein
MNDSLTNVMQALIDDWQQTKDRRATFCDEVAERVMAFMAVVYWRAGRLD